MEPIRAFVGHSFRREDQTVVDAILLCLKRVTQLHPNFSWEHAKEPEPSAVDAKVLRLFEDKTLFIGICTASELAVETQDVTRGRLLRSKLTAYATKFHAKASDWVLQEIGIAIGRHMDVILLVEDGVRRPGSLQGNLEYIPFTRANPEQCFVDLLGMIAALKSRGDGTTSSPEISQIPAASSAGPPKPESVSVVRPAAGEDLELAIFDAVFEGNDEKIAAIDARFQASEASSDEVSKRKWLANIEYLSIAFGQGGNVSELRRFAEQVPEIDPIWWDLALVYEKFDDLSSAGISYERASAAASEPGRKIAALGRAAVAFYKAGDLLAVGRIYEEIGRLASASAEFEGEVLEFEVNWAEATNSDELLLGALERMLQLDPTNHDRRFQLAYKYSNLEMNQLATFHYQCIPRPARTAMTWNNLGVAKTSLQLPGRAMTAFRKSEGLGETLAMSNIADRFIDSGFFPEAKDLLERALSQKDPDGRVASVLNRAEEARTYEDKKEAEVLEKAKLLSHFYREFGRALSRRVSDNLASKWVGPDCELELQRDGDRVVLSGVYEMPLGGLAAALMPKTTFAVPSPLLYRVEYRGAMRGHTIVATVLRGRIDEPVRTPSLLGNMEAPPIVALLDIAESESVIHVLERSKNSEARSYELTRK
jgi:tetratricopeptide (TPR) repeat protein